MLAVPSLPPKQLILVLLMLFTKAAGCVTGVEVMAVQAKASVTVTV